MSGIDSFEKAIVEIVSNSVSPNAGLLQESIFAQMPAVSAHIPTWEYGLEEARSIFGLPTDEQNLPSAIERITWPKAANILCPSVIGLGGPGAVGKGTIREILRKQHIPSIVNTTSRPARDYEVEGVDYYFRTEENIRSMYAKGELLTLTPRPGRGLYAITKDEVNRLLRGSNKPCLIEENPATLLQLAQSLEKEGKRMALVYLLPPSPAYANLVFRLYGRCSSDPAYLKDGLVQIPASVIDSTLGQRQIDEFLSLRNAIEAGVDVRVIMNDELQRVKKLVTSLLR